MSFSSAPPLLNHFVFWDEGPFMCASAEAGSSSTSPQSRLKEQLTDRIATYSLFDH